MRKISTVIIACNEEEKIGRALESVLPVADEIVVVDSGSRDGTADICRRAGARVICHPWEGYRAQKQFATEQAAHDWVLSLDADELLSGRLQRELLQWKGEETRLDGYEMARKTFFMGRWIEHTTWYPDWQLRLFRRSRGSWVGGRVHEHFALSGERGRFQHPLYHYTYASFSEYLEQLEHFSSLAALDYQEEGRRARLHHLLLYPAAAFLKNFVVRRGFLDGLPGLAVSTLASVSVLFKYLKLWELESKSASPATRHE